MVFAPPRWRVPLGTGYRRSQSKKTRMMELPDRERSLTTFLPPSGYNTPTWRTDRRSDTGRQQKPRLRIALRGKMSWPYSRGAATNRWLAKTCKHKHACDYYIHVLTSIKCSRLPLCSTNIQSILNSTQYIVVMSLQDESIQYLQTMRRPEQ